jgi:hypothetical protein
MKKLKIIGENPENSPWLNEQENHVNPEIFVL